MHGAQVRDVVAMVFVVSFSCRNRASIVGGRVAMSFVVEETPLLIEKTFDEGAEYVR